jgi:hypothetical protein
MELTEAERAELKRKFGIDNRFGQEEAIYLAGMRAGIEEAAKVCDKREDRHSLSMRESSAYAMHEACSCADAIRALLQPDAPETDHDLRADYLSGQEP